MSKILAGGTRDIAYSNLSYTMEQLKEEVIHLGQWIINNNIDITKKLVMEKEGVVTLSMAYSRELKLFSWEIEALEDGDE